MLNTISEIKNLPFVSFVELKLLPEVKGIYFIVEDNDILYVGMSRNIKKRLMTHTRRSFIHKKNKSSVVHYLLVEDDKERQKLEYNLIKTFKPRYDCYREFSNKPPSQKFLDMFDKFLISIIEHKPFGMEAFLNGK